MKRKLFLLALLFIILSTSVSAQGMLVSNSQDWKDVYSVEIFGNLMGVKTMFLTGQRHATILHFSIPKSNIEIISSINDPFVVGYDMMLLGQGLTDVEETAYSNINLELARRLENITKFVIVDDSYGYNALAVASFASMAGYYVLFTDDRTIGDIEDYLATVDVEEIIIYGQVDREVRGTFAQYNPEIVNTGDRFDNNIEIVKKYLELRPTKQAILTNGEFIEQSLMEGFDPVLFIGSANVPDKIREFIQHSEIDIGILIGNELIGTATTIRRQVGISVFVKFAQGARVPGGSISAVEDLDRFPMPKYEFDFRIFSVFYNKATGSLEVTYRNNAEIANYFKSTISIFSGDQTFVVGDEEPVFIDGGEFKTITYELELLEDENATAEFFIVFGESKNSLEFTLQGTFPIESITILDEAVLNITDLYYDARTGAFYVEFENFGTVDAYVDVEIIDVWINGQFITIGGDEVSLIKPGENGRVKASVDLEDEDIAHRLNQELEVKALYGERENTLIKSLKGTFAFKMKETDYTIYFLISVVVILAILIFLKRRKKKEAHH